MVASLHLSQFTVFEDVRLDFAKNLNVFLGENGSGKTHALKALYAVLAAEESLVGSRERSIAGMTECFRHELQGAFRPTTLRALIRGASPRAAVTVLSRHAGISSVAVVRSAGDLPEGLLRSLAEESDGVFSHANSAGVHFARPLYLPPTDFAALGPAFAALYDASVVPFDKSWRALAGYVALPPLRELPAGLAGVLHLLEDALGGPVQTTPSGTLVVAGKDGPVELPMVSEGLKKFAVLAHLLKVGAFTDTRQRGSAGNPEWQRELARPLLLWDEPEAHLNPRLLRKLARVIVALADYGTPIVLATHSLFLLRELHLLQRRSDAPLATRYFGFERQANGSVSVEQSDHLEGLGPLAALDEEVAQAERYIDDELGAGDAPT